MVKKTHLNVSKPVCMLLNNGWKLLQCTQDGISWQGHSGTLSRLPWEWSVGWVNCNSWEAERYTVRVILSHVPLCSGKPHPFLFYWRIRSAFGRARWGQTGEGRPCLRTQAVNGFLERRGRRSILLSGTTTAKFLMIPHDPISHPYSRSSEQR